VEAEAGVAIAVSDKPIGDWNESFLYEQTVDTYVSILFNRKSFTSVSPNYGMAMDNYFDHEEENAVGIAFLMIIDGSTDYENIEDVLIGETTWDERRIREWKQKQE